MDYFAVHIGQRLKTLMQARGITPKAMAEHCGVTPGAVSNWFATGRISKPNLLQVCQRLEVPLADVISGEAGERDTVPPLKLTDEERALILAYREHLAKSDDARPALRQMMERARESDPVPMKRVVRSMQDRRKG